MLSGFQTWLLKDTKLGTPPQPGHPARIPERGWEGPHQSEANAPLGLRTTRMQKSGLRCAPLWAPSGDSRRPRGRSHPNAAGLNQEQERLQGGRWVFGCALNGECNFDYWAERVFQGAGVTKALKEDGYWETPWGSWPAQRGQEWPRRCRVGGGSWRWAGLDSPQQGPGQEVVRGPPAWCVMEEGVWYGVQMD